jgi:hypothetical protein
MATVVTVTPPDQIAVTATTDTEFVVSVTAPSFAVTVSPSGAQGIQGPTGEGVPPGGSTNQRLVKKSATDFDTQWVSQAVTPDKQVQFALNGAITGDEDFIYDKDEKCLAIGKPTILDDNPIAMSGNVDSWIQANIQNKNAGVDASSDYICTADTGDDTQGYADWGIGNSGYASAAWDIQGPLDTYGMGDGGSLVLGTLSVAKSVKIFAAQTDHEAHPADAIVHFDQALGLSMQNSHKVREGTFALTDLITECDGVTAQTAAFAAGSKIVIRTDLL